jgi:hypothetical protein
MTGRGITSYSLQIVRRISTGRGKSTVAVLIYEDSNSEMWIQPCSIKSHCTFLLNEVILYTILL